MTYLGPRMSPAEGAAWLGLIKVCELLPNELDSQLQRDASLTHFEFQVLTFLRFKQDSTAPMSEIADGTTATLSRLSHVCSRLQLRGLVEKSVDPGDRRVTRVTLTGAGRRVLIHAIPGHIQTARHLVIDALSDEDLAHLTRITALLGERLDPDDRFGGRR
jgi:DNA-binding MarR family transcriptional regulator